MKMLLECDTGSEVTFDSDQRCSFFCEGVYYSESFRSVLRSDEIGVALLGQANISPFSGRLQLIDATGSIDVLIPDLHSTWDVKGIYAVNDFTLVMEGVAEPENRLEILSDESFSCRSIFNSVPCRRAEVEVAIYLLYHIGDTKLLDHPCNPIVKDNRNFAELHSGKFHMLVMTHKYPFKQKFQGEPDMTNSSSLFAEAFLLPWDLYLLGKDGLGNPAELSVDLLAESEGAYASGNSQDFVRSKRLKTDQGSSGKHLSCLLDSCTTNAISYGLQRCTDLSSSPEIPCSVTYRSINNQLSSCSAFLCGSNSIKVSSGKKARTHKLLLEFKSESFCKHQLLKVGGYYIIKHQKEDVLCAINAISYVNRCKVIVSSTTHLWSFSFSTNQVHPNGDVHDPPGSVDLTDETFSNDHLQSELLFPGLNCEFPLSESDVTIQLSNCDLDFLKDNIKRLDESLIKPLSLNEVANFSLSNEMSELVQSPVYLASDYQLPAGNLISLHGKVLSVHNCGCNASSSLRSSFRRGEVLTLAKSVCIHILVDHHPIRIFGSSSNHVYPVGFGPGCIADFHRILVLSGRNKLIMTPSSYIEIKSVRLTAGKQWDKASNESVPSDLCTPASLDNIPSVLISEIMQYGDCKPVQFHCKTVAICALLMEKNRKAVYPGTSSHTGSAVFQIPLAGFVLDDGSSFACFWANHETAATLLRLNEKVPPEMARNTWGTKKIKEESDRNSIIHQVGQIVKKLGFVTVRNYGSVYDSTGQNLTFSVTSNTVFNVSDEEFLKRVILHACLDTCLVVVGSFMDWHDVKKLEKRLAEMDMTMHPMQNIRVHEVRRIDPLSEARRVMKDLGN